MKIVFFGTPDFAVESLKRLVDGGYDVAAVVTMPDKIGKRGHGVIQSPVKEFALAHSLPLLQPERLKDEKFVSELAAINADLFIVIAFRMLPQVVWDMPRLGTFNLHGSLLPQYRGAAPINWAIINGEKRTGVTTFFLKHEIDTGDIIDQVAIDIDPDDDFGSVYDRLMRIGADLCIKTVDGLISGKLTSTPQDDILKGATPTPAPKIFKDTCLIDWCKSAHDIHNLVRGLSPVPAAWASVSIDGQEPVQMKVYQTRVADDTATAGIGKFSVANGKVTVGCGIGTLELVSIQMPGKKRMDADAAMRGIRGSISFV